MSVIIRLARGGNNKRPAYRIVAAEAAKPVTGKFLEVVGNYIPRGKVPTIILKEARIRYWIENGALPSETVRSLIMKQIPGLVEGREKNKLGKTQAARKARKARLAKSKKEAPAKAK